MCKNCGNKATCTGAKVYDVCVEYQGEILDHKLKEKDLGCHNIQEVVEDIVDYLENDLRNTTGLGDKCIEYKLNNKGKITQKTINETFEEKICDLYDLIDENDLLGEGINCRLNYGDLVSECDKPKTICEALQLIINEINNLKNE